MTKMEMARALVPKLLRDEGLSWGFSTDRIMNTSIKDKEGTTYVTLDFTQEGLVSLYMGVKKVSLDEDDTSPFITIRSERWMIERLQNLLQKALDNWTSRREKDQKEVDADQVSKLEQLLSRY